MSVFLPNSPQALAITNLFIILLLMGAAIFLLVTGLVLYMILRFRARPGEAEPRQIFGQRRIEVIWTAGPIILIGIIFGLSVSTMQKADPPVNQAQPDLIITGYQWWWDVRYPKSGVATANEIHIPTGRPMLVELRSGDVIHNFWVPQLSRKLDLVPGQPNHLWLESDKAGTFLGACGEYCGTEHAWMRLRVIAQPPAEFDAWLQQQAQVPTPPTGLAAQGAQTFQQLTCANCHAIAGTPAQARFAPDLTHVGSRQTLAAGVLTDTPENLAKWLKDPNSVKPGTLMPNLQLTDAQVGALVAYLESLK